MIQEDERSDREEDHAEKSSVNDRDGDEENDRERKEDNKDDKEGDRERFSKGGESQPTCSLLVRNLAFHVRAEEIRHMMEQ